MLYPLSKLLFKKTERCIKATYQSNSAQLCPRVTLTQLLKLLHPTVDGIYCMYREVYAWSRVTMKGKIKNYGVLETLFPVQCIVCIFTSCNLLHMLCRIFTAHIIQGPP